MSRLLWLERPGHRSLAGVRTRAVLQTIGGRQQGLACAAELRAAGISSSALSRALARSEVCRVRPGVYGLGPLGVWPVHAVTHLGVAPELVQHVRAVLLSLGEQATAAGRTAACLRGWGLLLEPQREQDVVVVRGRWRVRLAGVRVLQRRRVLRELVQPIPDVAPLWVTTAVATVLDCCRTLPHEQAVVVCDSALRSGQVSLAQLHEAARRLRGVREAARVRRALASCDPEAGSVLESVLRLRMVAAGIAGFSTQLVLLDQRHRHIVRADFCFEGARLVVETDGARWHQDPVRDQRLDNRLAAAGWRVLRFTWAQVVHDPASVLVLIENALAHGNESAHLALKWAAAAA